MSGSSTHNTENHSRRSRGRFYTSRNYRSCYPRNGNQNRPCGRWNCTKKKCRDLWLHRHYQKIVAGIYEIIDKGANAYFVTLSLQNSHQETVTWTEINKVQGALNNALKEMRNVSKIGNRPPHSVRVSGVKSKLATAQFQLHNHVIISAIPDAVPAPTIRYPDRMRSKALEKIARKYGLKVWIENVYDVEGIARYLCQNLQNLNAAALRGHIDLPSGYRRISYSQNWWKTDYEKRRAKRQREKRANVLSLLAGRSNLARPATSAIIIEPFSLSASSGNWSSTVFIERSLCIALLSNEFKREITFYSPLYYSSRNKTRAELSTLKSGAISTGHQLRGGRTNVTLVSVTIYEYCAGKRPAFRAKTYLRPKSIDWLEVALARPPPV